MRTTALMWGRVASLSVLGLLVMAGCIVGPSSEEELATFKEAGPVQLQVDLAKLLRKRMSSGPYRLIPGDVLELQMPAVTSRMPGKAVADETESYFCRVDANGNVILPIVGEVAVAGRTISEIEAIITDLYHPKYFFQKPSIVASVDEYRVIAVSVVGALEEPGVYELRSNEKTLISALMKAGGIAEDGATAIYIHHADQDKSKAVVIPVVGLNIPARDVELADGDTIVVESSEPQVITVIGLVNKPGLFPWSTKNRYNVMDALAFAGGINDV
ncbi:MAG: polysaccharide biosynthesis/export family protein, partial [Planctomycetota bacterium]|nr:polysaccharide biosynthesis/export family protein [Planctomycetota bacterium]